jgi:hypothetical protein
MQKIFTNIPPVKNNDSANSTRDTINNFYSVDLPIDAGTFEAIKGFFEHNGFSKVSSDTIAYVILYQAYIDGYNPMQVLENIQGLNGVQLNALVTEILNFNRFKTSFLGFNVNYQTNSIVSKEILA